MSYQHMQINIDLSLLKTVIRKILKKVYGGYIKRQLIRDFVEDLMMHVNSEYLHRKLEGERMRKKIGRGGGLAEVRRGQGREEMMRGVNGCDRVSIYGLFANEE